MDKMLFNPAGLGEPRLAPEHQQSEHPEFAANQKQLLWQQTATSSCGWLDGAGRSGAQSRCARQVTAAPGITQRRTALSQQEKVSSLSWLPFSLSSLPQMSRNYRK